MMNLQKAIFFLDDTERPYGNFFLTSALRLTGDSRSLLPKTTGVRK
jgi:hypothetical protein